MRLALLTAVAGLAFATPALADTDTGGAGYTPELHDHHPALKAAVASAARDDDRARDQYRHPFETLDFFGVRPDMTVAEYAPGGGWYTRVIAPYVGQDGQYIGLNFGPGGGVPESMNDRLTAFPATFGAQVIEQTGIPAENVSAFIATQVPEDVNGTVDRVLIIRMLHNMMRWGIADTEIMAIREMLADDGMVGIVQHRAPEGQPYDMTDGNRGYLRQSDVIAFMQAYGFELAGMSDVNANPADTADWERGVWELPPTLGTKREELREIGESDRMTLLFRKRQ
ncbi:class I SAM-dependent methyltransferase [Alteriqipengyuania sp.]|uniref:class I SAM-dependent methyltransferase n=1 Tax=Alteriqipengyuania sp. TaxID=2800692 RepID=UPI003511C36B